MLVTLTLITHYTVLLTSLYTFSRGINTYLNYSDDLSRVMNKFLLYAILITFMILATSMYRITIPSPYMVTGGYATWVYITQFCVVLLAFNIIKTARKIAKGHYDN